MLLSFRRKTLIFFKDMLKEVLKSKGLKQKWLAHKLGVSEVTVSSWVKEKSVPSKKHIDKICELMEISAKDLTN